MEPEDFNWKIFCWWLDDDKSFVYLDRNMKYIDKNKRFDFWECFDENWVAEVELDWETFLIDENLNIIKNKEEIEEYNEIKEKEMEEREKEEERIKKEERTININNLSIELKPHPWQVFIFKFNWDWENDYQYLTKYWLYTMKKENFQKLLKEKKEVSSIKITWKEELEIFIVD